MIGVFLLAATLQADFEKLAASSDGRVGICALEVTERNPICVHGRERFSLQSVMKLVVAAAVFDAVDRKLFALSEVMVVRPTDASPGPQDFADRVRKSGSLQVTLEELVRLAVNESDSTAADLLLERLGGIAVLQEFMRRKKIEGIRIDRNERSLQAEIVGLIWRPEYADQSKLRAATERVPPKRRDEAWAAYLKDERDTATPEGMVRFLQSLVRGKLLSAGSTKKLLAILEETKTGLDRLRAGAPQGWTLGHKTGTSSSWKGMRAATNDVGLLTAPDGRQIAVAVFVAASKRSDGELAAVIAAAARLVTASYRQRD
jgi:beta-lactamase class A